ncbi:MAG: glycosyltransferase family 39 protein, partial [Bacteroidota bacterium]
MVTLSGRGFAFNLVTLIVFIFLAVLFTGPVGNFPIGDDWQYGYPVMTWVENGTMEYKGVFAPNILLQVAWGYLFCAIGGGFDFTWLRFSTLMSAFIALIYFYKIMRSIKVKESISLLIVALLFFSPLFYYLSFTFFTDIPFLCLCIISIYFFIKYILANENKYLVLAVFWAGASFYIRQPGLLFIPVFSLFILWKNRFSKKAIFVGTLLVLLAFGVY